MSILLLGPSLFLIEHGGVVGNSFLKAAICFLTAARWCPNLAAFLAVLIPSHAKRVNLVFSSPEMSDFLPIAVHFAENFKKIIGIALRSALMGKAG
jgi:hypothetical protein